MKKKGCNVKELIQKAMVDSMNFSRKNGPQIFFNYSPHVDSVEFYAYQNGWNTDERTFTIDIYIGDLRSTVKEVEKSLKPIYDFIKQNSKQRRHEDND